MRFLCVVVMFICVKLCIGTQNTEGSVLCFVPREKKRILSWLRAFNEVKATSRAHDKKVSLNTNRNYSSLQASKPWASPEEVADFARGRGAPRGRGLRSRGGGGRPGNQWHPRNEYNARGLEYGMPPKTNWGRGQFNQTQRFQHNGPQQQQGPSRNNNNQGNYGGNSNNANSAFQQKKTRPPNKGFQGGGN